MRLEVDENIYLKEDRSQRVKKCFKDLADLLRDSNQHKTHFLDVGCATGELMRYVQDEFPDFMMNGCDVSQKMIQSGSDLVPSANFYVGSVSNENGMTEEKYDVVTCFGVITIFDDLKIPLRNLLSAVRAGGRLIIFGNFNLEPIDLRAQVKRSDGDSDNWLQGYNCWSQLTLEKLLNESGRVRSLKWHKFMMDENIPKTSDPLRAWTFETAECKFQQRRGSGQLINQFFLDIQCT